MGACAVRARREQDDDAQEDCGERASEAREGKEWLLHDGNFDIEGMNRANLNQVFVVDVGNFVVVGEECEPLGH